MPATAVQSNLQLYLRQLNEVKLLTADEEKQLLEDWNQTQAEFPQHVTIHDLFYLMQPQRTRAEIRRDYAEL